MIYLEECKTLESNHAGPDSSDLYSFAIPLAIFEY